MTLFSLEHLYWLAGAMLLVAAARIAADRRNPLRLSSALFWGLFGLIFVLGNWVPSVFVGYAVFALVFLAAAGRVATGAATVAKINAGAAGTARLGNRIFLPALLIPLCAVVLPFALGPLHGRGWALLEARQAALVAVSLGAVVALAAAMRLVRARGAEPVHEGIRLLGAVGWAVLLPQLLASLGGIFTVAGVGAEIAKLVSVALPHPGPFAAVLVYCLGMAVFTMCLGNAFAAFALITAGVGVPFVVKLNGGNPAIMGAIGMLSGYCGTLLTPMAANFNIVPALLLELPDRYAVIRAQAPLAAVIFTANVVLLWQTVYRF